MNVYDFDKTIYSGDCTVDFWLHCMKKYPQVVLALPVAAAHAVAFKAGICSREKFKESFYRFLRFVPDVPKEVKIFWDQNQNKIKPFYLAQRKPEDVIISASPDFLLQTICARLSVTCIASAVNPKTGFLEGPNCRGEEKVHRFRDVYGNTQIDDFYSDSQSDRYLASYARQAYIVKGDQIGPWGKHP